MADNAPKIGLLQRIRYALEFIPIILMIGLFLIMGPDTSSNFAGKLARKYGPKLAKNRKVLSNLKMALPGRTDEDYKNIIAGMWDNLGRVFAEFPYLSHHALRMDIVGIEHLKSAFDEYGQVVLFSGHLANWEIIAPTLIEYGVEIDIVYRAPNNPYVNRILDYYRSLNGRLITIPKSRAGTRMLVEHLQNNRSVLILIDQKYNEGIAAPFFGHPAMTSTAFAQLGQKFDCPVIPFRVERIDKTQFRLSFYEPLRLFDEDGASRPATDLVNEAHALLESWITERPEQWLWLHRRWVDRKNPGKKVAAKLSQANAAKTSPDPLPDRK